MDIQNILQSYKVIEKDKNLPISERHELISKFSHRLNDLRKAKGYKPLPSKFYAIKMYQSGLKSNFDLYWFYKYCDESKNFDSCWWFALDIKNIRK